VKSLHTFLLSLKRGRSGIGFRFSRGRSRLPWLLGLSGSFLYSLDGLVSLSLGLKFGHLEGQRVFFFLFSVQMICAER
jgi:hypothetical protein